MGILRRAAPPGRGGVIASITPADAGWDYVGYVVHRLAAGETLRRPGDGAEVAVIVLAGRVAAHAGATRFDAIGERRSVFDPAPASLLLVEPGASVQLVALEEAVVSIASAPGGPVRCTRLVEPGSVLVEERGSGGTSRRVAHLLPPAAEAGRLIVFEVTTPAGNWSSYPPHKHDVDDPPRESRLEELYHFRFARPEGYALERVYTADGTLDETVAPRHDDLVLVPRGYHAVAMPPGYDGWYLNVMAGPERRWAFTVDPDHAWLMDWEPPAS